MGVKPGFSQGSISDAEGNELHLFIILSWPSFLFFCNAVNPVFGSPQAPAVKSAPHRQMYVQFASIRNQGVITASGGIEAPDLLEVRVLSRRRDNGGRAGSLWRCATRQRPKERLSAASGLWFL